MAKRILSLIVAAAVASFAMPALAADSLLGDWRNTNNTVHLKLEKCGTAVCGRVTWASESQEAAARKGSGKTLAGLTLLRELRMGKNGAWRGKVFIPAINSNANATVTVVDSKKLRVSGCVVLGVVCRTQHWHRMP